MYNMDMKQPSGPQVSRFGKPLGFQANAQAGAKQSKPQQVSGPKFNPATFKTQHKG